MHDQAHDVALEVMTRLQSPHRIERIATDSARRLGAPGLWDAPSYSTGFAGLAVGQLALSATDPTAAEVAAQHMRAAIERVAGRSTISITAGFGSVAAAMVVAAAISQDYVALATRGCDWLAAESDRVAGEQQARWRAGEPWADERMWDGACGLAGAGRVLLAAHEHGLGDYEATLRSICAVLARLTEPAVGPDGERAPGWWIPPGVQVRSPNGGWNPGLAHGISGPLVTLAATWRSGIVVPGHRDAISAIAGQLTAARADGHRWPHTISLTGEQPGDSEKARSAWCYGAAGVGRAVYLAGAAIGDQQLVDGGLAALRATAAQDAESWNLWGPTFCHGYAGMLHIVNRTATETGDAVLVDQAVRLAAIILAAYRDSAKFGFVHMHDQTGAQDANGNLPGILTGAAGTALALLSWSNPDTPSWDLPLLVT